MTLTIKLPNNYDFSTADECAMQMADAVASLELRLANKVEHSIAARDAADRKLHLYRSIAAALDAILSAQEFGQLKAERQQAKDAQLAVDSLPANVAKPSATEPTAVLRCNGCNKVAPAADFTDGRACPVISLQADFYACPACAGFAIFPAEVTP